MKYIHAADLSHYARCLVMGDGPWTSSRRLVRQDLSRFSLDHFWEAREYAQQERNFRTLMNYRTRAKTLGLQSAEIGSVH